MRITKLVFAVLLIGLSTSSVFSEEPPTPPNYKGLTTEDVFRPQFQDFTPAYLNRATTFYRSSDGHLLMYRLKVEQFQLPLVETYIVFFDEASQKRVAMFTAIAAFTLVDRFSQLNRISRAPQLWPAWLTRFVEDRLSGSYGDQLCVTSGDRTAIIERPTLGEYGGTRTPTNSLIVSMGNGDPSRMFEMLHEPCHTISQKWPEDDPGD
ncbi:hypothetical protein [Hypericibacter adhaerens]|uniref:hypothetical protein n=1 Tax=Hypericibacter adhaerens TaxID=2602016 RepID=UPI001243FB9E|nr:hypothetical protein [Hypericibacter adhaerens]